VPLTVRTLGRALTVCLALALPGASAAEQIALGPVRVVYDDPALRPYAERVARLAARELMRVAAVFGRSLAWPAGAATGSQESMPTPVIVRITTDNDAFNAFGLPVPRPSVVLRALEPSLVGIGLGSEDALATLLRHEFVHLVHLDDPRTFAPGSDGLPELGLVGQRSFPLPPAWLLEGLATWIESRPEADAGAVDRGGRLFATRTRALLLALAADGAFPSLADVSLATFEAWPAGEARYLLGAAFVDELVRHTDFATLLDALHAFHGAAGSMTFAGAWRSVTGSDLEDAWAAWQARLEAEARQAFDRTAAAAPQLLRAAVSSAAAVAPDGRALAWAAGNEVVVASIEDLTVGVGNGVTGSGSAEVRTFDAPPGLYAVEWLDENTLLLGGYARQAGSVRSELFTVDVGSGLLSRVTHLGRIRLPSADGAGCAWFVRDRTAFGTQAATDDPSPLQVRHWCVDGRGGGRWSLPTGVQVADVAAAPDGAVALLLVRGGERWLEVLEPTGAGDTIEDATYGGGVRRVGRFAMPSGAGDVAWRGADGLMATVVEGDTMRMLAWRVLREDGRVSLVPAMASPSTVSAFSPAAAADGVVFVTLRGTGPVLAWWPWDAWEAWGGDLPPDAVHAALPDAVPAVLPDAVPDGVPDAASGAASDALPDAMPADDLVGARAEPYRPVVDLAPYGWLPTAASVSFAPSGVAFEVVVPAQDVTGEHELRWTVGYDSARHGALGGAYGSARYAYRMPTLVPDTRPAAPVAFAFTLGGWPHRPHRHTSDAIAFGVRIEALLRGPVATASGTLATSLELVTGVGPGWRLGGSIDAVVSELRGDAFGLARSGWRAGWHARFAPTPTEPSFGTWVSADTLHEPRQGSATATGEGLLASVAAPAHLRFGVVAGYRPATPVPVGDEYVVLGSLAARWQVPVRWRLGDGMVAWERLRLEPAVRGWVGFSSDAGASDLGNGAHTPRLGIGADLGVGLDAVIDYLAPVTLTLRGGVADGAWLRLELGTAY